MQDLWTISFFLIFFHEVRHHKVRKVKDLIHWDIYVFLLQDESYNGLLTFSKNNMFGKNLVLELWSKNPKTNQSTGFFEIEYLTNKLRYDVEFLDVTRGP